VIQQSAIGEIAAGEQLAVEHSQRVYRVVEADTQRRPVKSVECRDAIGRDPADACERAADDQQRMCRACTVRIPRGHGQYLSIGAGVGSDQRPFLPSRALRGNGRTAKPSEGCGDQVTSGRIEHEKAPLHCGFIIQKVR
jgi:hypothetical protein